MDPAQYGEDVAGLDAQLCAVELLNLTLGYLRLNTKTRCRKAEMLPAKSIFSKMRTCSTKSSNTKLLHLK